jgi:hypothetical protein
MKLDLIFMQYIGLIIPMDEKYNQPWNFYCCRQHQMSSESVIKIRKWPKTTSIKFGHFVR